MACYKCSNLSPVYLADKEIAATLEIAATARQALSPSLSYWQESGGKGQAITPGHVPGVWHQGCALSCCTGSAITMSRACIQIYLQTVQEMHDCADKIVKQLRKVLFYIFISLFIGFWQSFYAQASLISKLSQHSIMCPCHHFLSQAPELL